MTDNKDKKPSPVTTAILDGVCETLGVYRRVDAKEVQYDYEWLLSPLVPLLVLLLAPSFACPELEQVLVQ